MHPALVGGALSMLPAWTRGTVERILAVVPGGAEAILSIDLVTALLPSSMHAVISDVR